jgi:arginine repressor
METVSKYIWLLELLQRKQRLTKKEICDYWQDSGLNVTGESLNERTFHRWIAKIEELFGVEVVCTSGYEYKIDNPEELDASSITQWLINTTSVSNMLNEYKGIREQIVIDTVAVNAELLHTFLDAIRDKKRLKIVYHRFQEAEPRQAETVEPYCLRCFQNRWYAAVRYLCDGEIKLIAFDRIVSAVATDESYELPKDFDAHDLFKYDYGIGIGFGEQPTRIVLQISAKQRKYTDALPLHWSQKEIEHHEDYSLYELYMKPTRDLARAILPYGANIRVIAPDSLRRTVASLALDAYKNNKFNEESNIKTK